MANTTTVILIRHGRTPTTGVSIPGRAKGLHLSGEGHQQAKNVAAYVAAMFNDVAAIYASPLEHAQETAEPIAHELGLSVVTDPGLLETDAGDWTGVSLEELTKRPEWQIVQRRPSTYRIPNGEGLLEMQGRITDTIERLRAQHAGSTIVLVSHADPIKAAVAVALGTAFDLYQRIIISPCSVSVLEFGEVTTSVLAVNTTVPGTPAQP